MTKIFGILAFPASHSKSPQMHTAALEHLNIDAKYEYFEIAPQDLDLFFFEKVKTRVIEGLSVSLPYKEAVIPFLDMIDEAGDKIGAINTIFWEKGKLSGTNTDWIGFSESLREKYEIEGKNILVLGAGGATRAILYALQKEKGKNIFLWNRTQKKSEELAKEFLGVTPLKGEIKELNFDEIDLIINTTSLGMEGENEDLSPFPKELWKPHHTAFDIVYTPLKTVFLNDAQTAGANIITGEKMLLFQGMHQFKLFTKRDAPKEIMEKALYYSKFKIQNHELKKGTTILEVIIEQKKEEIQNIRDYSETSLCEGDFSFYKTLSQQKKSPHLIAEIKPISPSKGRLFREEDSVEDIAAVYTQNGASAISVLTDEPFFGGNIRNLGRARKMSSLPLLRKDFILHEKQIYESRKHGADAILLMRNILSAKKIQEFLEICTFLKIDALVEVHDDEELKDVLQNTSAKIIGINNRNLKTLEINKNNFNALTEKYKKELEGKILVCESGVSSKEDIQKYAQNAHAVLVGSSILLSENRAEKIREIGL